MGGKLQRGGVDGVRELTNYISRKYSSEVPDSEWCFGKSKIFVSSPQTVFLLEEYREEAIDPKGYADKVREHERMEQAAAKQEAKVGKRGSAGCCVIN